MWHILSCSCSLISSDSIRNTCLSHSTDRSGLSQSSYSISSGTVSGQEKPVLSPRSKEGTCKYPNPPFLSQFRLQQTLSATVFQQHQKASPSAFEKQKRLFYVSEIDIP